MKEYSEEYILQKTLLLAKKWQEQLIENREISEFQQKLKSILEDKKNVYFLIRLLDNCFQSKNPTIISNKIEKMFVDQEIPSFFSFSEKTLIRLFLLVGKHFPQLSVPQIIQQVQKQTSDAVFIQNTSSLANHLKKRKSKNIQNNVNLIGETVLGEQEAVLKLEEYLEALKRPEIQYLSIKLSNLYSQISPLSFDNSVRILIYRLTTLYKEAKSNFYLKGDQKVYKFINLDMEEYRDVELTVHVFIQTMEQDIFHDFSAGIVLQAYLPDSYIWFETLSLWAEERVKRGGAPIKVRIVKGANLAMERIDASLNGWDLATYSSKDETDANYKRLVDIALHPKNIEAVHIGIASHNLFDLAYAKTLIELRGITYGVSFEMLEGMANTTIPILDEKNIILYTPIAEETKFINAIGYLVRRLDEISDPQNFLSHSFHLEKSWDFLENQFINAYHQRHNISSLPKRRNTRIHEHYSIELSSFFTGKFVNDSPTDFCILSNRNWVQNIQKDWKSHKLIVSLHPTTIERQTILIKHCYFNEFIGQVELANPNDMNDAFFTASKSEWLSLKKQNVSKILAQATVLFKKNRYHLIGVMVSETGKTIVEADVEVSEAIDFLEYYTYSLKDFEYESKGIGVVISPWNFPIAIPTGGIVAGLAGGNAILFKPSSQAILCGYLICQYLWEAGVPKDALHFLPSSSSIFEKEILLTKSIQFIIFTGSTATALKIKNLRKDIPLYAETGGKNVTIVTNHADKDQAIKNVIYSAFGHTGQKCSATSLLLLEKDIFEDDDFKKKFVDAIKSLYVGDVWDVKNKIGPMITPPQGELEKAMKFLENNESWLIPPKIEQTNPRIIFPCVKWNVSINSHCFMTELFGPLLGVVCFSGGIQEAVKIANQTGYGLTAGLESLDKEEIAYWKENMIAGNLYINRSTTGAIVQRQPFGGYRKSSIGAGIKAGGPNYALQFVNMKEETFTTLAEIPFIYQEFFRNVKEHPVWKSEIDFNKLSHGLFSYVSYYKDYFSKSWDPSNVLGERNELIYKPFKKIIIRITTHDDLTDIILCMGACLAINCSFELNFEEEGKNFEFFECFSDYFPLSNVFDSDEELLKKINYDVRLRYMSFKSISETILNSTSQNGFYISYTKPSANGRIELLNYLQEQSISHRFHRYGNLGV